MQHHRTLRAKRNPFVGARVAILMLGSALMVAAGCTAHAGEIEQEQSKSSSPPRGANFAGKILFGKELFVATPASAQGATKRGFADFTGDGVEDMIEVRNDGFLLQNWNAHIFPGRQDTSVDPSVLRFENTPMKVSLPVREGFGAKKTKFDTADINGDGYADIVLSQYKESLLGIFETVTLHAAINQRNLTFQPATFTTVEQATLAAVLTKWFGEIPASIRAKDEDFDDWVQLDWVDMTNDDKDDLVLMWKQSWGRAKETLHYQIFPTQSVADGNISFSRTAYGTVPGFLWFPWHGSESLSNVDTEDYNNDGFGDFYVYHPWDGQVGDWETHLAIRVAFRKTDQPLTGNAAFQAHKRHQFDEKAAEPSYGNLNDVLLKFDKRDTFDMNDDGCADYVHISKFDGKKQIRYRLIQCF